MKTTEPILMPIGISGPQGKSMKWSTLDRMSSLFTARC